MEAFVVRFRGFFPGPAVRFGRAPALRAARQEVAAALIDPKAFGVGVRQLSLDDFCAVPLPDSAPRVQALAAAGVEARRAAEQQQREINAVAGMQQPAAPAAPADPAAATAAAAQAAIAADEPEPEEEPTAQFDPSQATNAEMARVQRYAPNGRLFDDEEDEDDGGTRMFDTDEEDEDDYEEERPAERRGRYADDEEESEDDIMAERIIRWAPPITAIVCALIVAVSLIYYFVIA